MSDLFSRRALEEMAVEDLRDAVDALHALKAEYFDEDARNQEALKKILIEYGGLRASLSVIASALSRATGELEMLYGMSLEGEWFSRYVRTMASVIREDETGTDPAAMAKAGRQEGDHEPGH